MIDQAKPAPSFAVPLCCFKVKARSFFIFFSIIFFLVHLWVPTLYGLHILSESLRAKERDFVVNDINMSDIINFSVHETVPKYVDKFQGDSVGSKFRRILSGNSLSSRKESSVKFGSFHYQPDTLNYTPDNQTSESSLSSVLNNYSGLNHKIQNGVDIEEHTQSYSSARTKVQDNKPNNSNGILDTRNKSKRRVSSK